MRLVASASLKVTQRLASEIGRQSAIILQKEPQIA